MSPTRVGTYVVKRTPSEEVRPLPPDPPVDMSDAHVLLEQATYAVGRLDGLTSLLPHPSLFIYMYVRREAVLSSQIEGTQSSLSDLLLHETGEMPGVPLDDVAEVSSYVAALHHGLARMGGGFPLSLRLIREVHGVLLSSGRGSDKSPGEFRTSQNWIGGSRPGNAAFVPPPPERVMECMGELERFLHDGSRLPVLIKAALAHVQFETIHPFLDGNGRLGRLLITLLLCASGVLQEPTLYLSLFFKQNRPRYYDLLQKVRLEGAWEEWIAFFLEGVATTANQAVESARRIRALLSADRERVGSLKRIGPTALRLHGYLERHPLTSVPAAATALGLTFPPVQKSMHQLMEMGMIRELTGRETGRVYAYTDYLAILSEGTEPLPR